MPMISPWQVLSSSIPSTRSVAKEEQATVEKLSHLVKEHAPLQAQLNRTRCLMKSDTESSPAFKTALKIHLFRSAYFSSPLLAYCSLFIHEEQLCVCVCMCVCVYACVSADPIKVIFIPGVKCGFLHVYNVIWELIEGMHFYIVVIVNYVICRLCLCCPFWFL